MQLMTKAIEAKLPAMKATEGQADPEIIVKFFTPWSSWTWWAIEGEREENGDFLFFGLVDGHDKELGYWRLSELANLKGLGGLRVERDLHFEGHTLSEFSDLYPMAREG